MAGALLISDKEECEHVALSIQFISERFAIAARSVFGSRARKRLESRVDLGVRAMFALLQQRLLLHPVRVGLSNDNSEATFSPDLTHLLVQACRAD